MEDHPSNPPPLSLQCPYSLKKSCCRSGAGNRKKRVEKGRERRAGWRHRGSQSWKLMPLVTRIAVPGAESCSYCLSCRLLPGEHLLTLACSLPQTESEALKSEFGHFIKDQGLQGKESCSKLQSSVICLRVYSLPFSALLSQIFLPRSPLESVFQPPAGQGRGEQLSQAALLAPILS